MNSQSLGNTLKNCSLCASGLVKSFIAALRKIAVVRLKNSVVRDLQNYKFADLSPYYAHTIGSTCIVSNSSEYYALRISFYGHSIVLSCHCLISAFYYGHSMNTTAVTLMFCGHKTFFYVHRRTFKITTLNCHVILLSDVISCLGIFKFEFPKERLEFVF